jgi:hypothetical protein
MKLCGLRIRFTGRSLHMVRIDGDRTGLEWLESDEVGLTMVAEMSRDGAGEAPMLAWQDEFRAGLGQLSLSPRVRGCILDALSQTNDVFLDAGRPWSFEGWIRAVRWHRIGKHALTTKITGFGMKSYAELVDAISCGISPAYQVTFTAPQGSVCIDPATTRVVANTYGK